MMFSKLKNKGIGESFAIQKPDWHVLRLTIIFLVGYLVLSEIFFRLEPVQRGLTGPRIGSPHRQFEIQVASLEKLVKEGETIDCIFLGNSMVWLGINPLVVNETFREQTGQEIHCFNFGVSALPASSAGEIASVLVERYHPKLLIYGTFARDYTIPTNAEDAYVVTNTPWLKYQNGEINLKGWLYSKSATFQYAGHIRDLLFMNYLEDVFPQSDEPLYKTYGLDPKFEVRLDVRNSPDFESADNRDPVKWLGHYKIRQENLDGLQRITQQTNDNVHVIVIEMPFYESALEFLPNGEQDYDSYAQQVDEITASTSTPFWRLDKQPVLTPDDWWDYFHLNIQGTDKFSKWVGNQLAAAYLQGNLGVLP